MSTIIYLSSSSNGQTASGYSFALQKARAFNNGDISGVTYYIEPRLKLVSKEVVGDYYFCPNKFGGKNLVLPLSCIFSTELKKIADTCYQQLRKLEPDTPTDIVTVFSDRSLFLKINPHLANDDIPAHRLLKLCVDVYGYCIIDKKAYLQCEVTEWKVESILN